MSNGISFIEHLITFNLLKRYSYSLFSESFLQADFFYNPNITTHIALILMKNRINSTTSLKGDKGSLPGLYVVGIKRQRNVEAHKHHHCPIPKLPKKRKPSLTKQQSKVEISQEKLNEGGLHVLISNLINSSDRIASLLKEEDHGCSYEVYLQDRNKMVEQLERLISPAHQKQDKKAISLQWLRYKPTIRQDYLSKQLNAIKLGIDKAIHRKKRSKSTYQLLQTQSKPQNIYEELVNVRVLLTQEVRLNSTFKLKLAQQAKDIQRLQANFVYLQLLIFKSEQMLLQNLIDSNDSTQFSIIEKQKAAQILSSLRQTILYIRQQDAHSSVSITHKLKEEAQSMVLYISDMRKKALSILKEKEKSLKKLEQQEQNFQQLKMKVSRLNNEMGELVEQVDKKDELIEYLKLQNSNLKDDLRSMEQMVKQTKHHYQNIADELYLTNEKLKVLQSLLQGKEDQINELLNQIDSKNKELIVKLEQIQAKEEDIGALKQEYVKCEQSSAKVISTLSEEKKLLALEKQRKENQLKETQSKIKFLQEEGSILEKKIESVFNEEEDYKFKISLLQQKIEALEQQNQQLYKDIRQIQNSQSKSQADNIQKFNKLLQSQCATLKREVDENSKKIKFYQEQMLQLAKMTDTSYYEKVIEDNERAISQLTQKVRKYEIDSNIPPIVQENSQQIEAQNTPIQSMQELISRDQQDNPEGLSYRSQSKQADILQDLIDCMPSFQQREERSSNRSENVIDKLSISKAGHSGISGTSYYQIHVINQNLNKIDSQKAASPKKVPQQQLAVLNAAPKELSNYADFQLEIQHNEPPANHPKKEIEFSQDQNDSRDQRLSEVSRNVNVDKQTEGSEQRINDLEEEGAIDLSPVKSNQVHDLLMSTSDAGFGQSRRKGLSPIKNVDKEQQINAQIRFQGQIGKDNQISKANDDKEKARGNTMLSNNFGKIIRAKSCFDKDD